MDDGSQSDSLFARLGARRFGMRELLADAIADLPERERLVFTLYYYEELETSEIALVLGETVFAVFQLHASAVGRLKARLADPEKPEAEAESDLTPHNHRQ
jgi:RNA polymerase sigma factor for flagellar operon FliA